MPVERCAPWSQVEFVTVLDEIKLRECAGRALRALVAGRINSANSNLSVVNFMGSAYLEKLLGANILYLSNIPYYG